MKCIDLQVNGAFGIDLFRAGPEKLDELSTRLARARVDAFLPTLITAPEALWWKALGEVGRWVARAKRARPLGLHLEGPFLNPQASGVHPSADMRRATVEWLERIWRESSETVRLMTVAPEVHSDAELRLLCAWARRRGVRLSIGHSVATYEQARRAFDLGFTGVTHAWNAGRFHHRDPGVLGAALGRDDVYVMVIPDLVHAHAVSVEWILRMHPAGRVVFVSDCAPSAGLRDGEEADFGSFRVRQVAGEARVVEARGVFGAIGGSGMLLPQAVARFKKASKWARSFSVARWGGWCGGNAARWLR